MDYTDLQQVRSAFRKPSIRNLQDARETHRLPISTPFIVALGRLDGIPAMNVVKTKLPGMLIIEPKVFADARGFFLESYNQKLLAETAGINDSFVQDNHSRSARGVLRGLHYQIRQPQGKLVRAVSGSVLDVCVDIRRSSPAFAQWVGIEISEENKRILWVPKGFAHGFVVLSDYAEVLYKTTDYWAPRYERTIAWNDRDLAIDWRLTGAPVLSAKDSAGILLRDAEVFE